MPTRFTLASIAIPSLSGACMACLVAAAVLVTPASPLALGRADALLGRGDAAAAVEHYEAIGAASPFESVRSAALRRAARVYELELGRPADARRVLKRALALGVVPHEEAQLREQLGELYLADRDAEAAAHQFRLAFEANPSESTRLVRAAEIYASAGKLKVAQRMWARLKVEAPQLSGRADLGLAQLALARGSHSEALAPFQKASRSDDDGVATAARLGLATCYERLGELDGALAELDLADLPDNVLTRRVNALIERQAFAAVITED